ncbi:MAG: hypothetical protein KGL39_05020 [Patescibacteria group bacterium]|nr:hypothetical protein [Patescibacteria group bacterium]
MARVYKRKSNPLVEKVSVPLSTATLEKLRERADSENRTAAEIVRGMIERGLELAK